MARLEVRAATVTIPRPLCHPNRRQLPRNLVINVVLVREIDQPSYSIPVSWMLATTEPVATAAQVERVVDAYRARWVIEEFFKALKTGCAYEKRQLETFHAWAAISEAAATVPASAVSIRKRYQDGGTPRCEPRTYRPMEGGEAGQ